MCLTVLEMYLPYSTLIAINTFFLIYSFLLSAPLHHSSNGQDNLLRYYSIFKDGCDKLMSIRNDDDERSVKFVY